MEIIKEYLNQNLEVQADKQINIIFEGVK